MVYSVCRGGSTAERFTVCVGDGTRLNGLQCV